MRKSKKKKATKKGDGKGNKGNPSASNIIYKGPVVLHKEIAEQHLEPQVLAYNGTLTSSAGGVISAVYANGNASLGNCANFSSVANVFAECRVLAWEIDYLPYNRYSKTTTVCTPGIRVIDREVSTALTSIADGQIHESAKPTSLEDPWREVVHMSGVEESQFQSVTAFAATSWIKLYFTGLTISTSYGQIFLRYRVQFRGHPS